MVSVVLLNAAQPGPSFYRDVLPILQGHCQSCHRPGEIAPFSLMTYRETRPWAQAIGVAIESRKMPPWFADLCCGHFGNDPSLTPEQIAAIKDWIEAGAPEGNRNDAPPTPHWSEGWNIFTPDVVLKMPVPVRLPAVGDIEYTYEIVPTDFAEGRWVQMSELRPWARDHVHHAVVYIRPRNRIGCAARPLVSRSPPQPCTILT